MDLYILENNADERSFIQQAAHTITEFEKLPLTMALATDQPSALLAAFAQRANTDAVFLLDIDLGDEQLDGISVGQQIRHASRTAQIIYITEHPDESYLILKHQVMPLTLIEKSELIPDGINILNDALKTAVQAIRDMPAESVPHFTYHNGAEAQVLPVSDIYYFSSSQDQSGMIDLHASNVDDSFRGNIRDLSHKLPKFFECARGYLVNLDNAASVSLADRLITMVSGDKLEVSVRRVPELRKRLFTKTK
ncbi:LytTR family DNA-binding domain-containing protein [Lacticaseibacillus pabuli]|uniref:LytTR family DNA-binding domain-containing protein n=1 Tax=Lacticaseibacillus pabuli TaxID=3025672 RepID=A0ABY7WU81_9LACO|nr:LytTR family DNA-binding domain-containing protein [Lacticaseibacillus sp. KACC 23028]WDF82715.1 LytTR family DNA-binding domain-containing protein [Lacticaseibacillus sp. KACC 23028]